MISTIDVSNFPETSVQDACQLKEPTFPESRIVQNPRSAAQVEASRLNGAKSRGPITAQGRQAVVHNAVKHGLLARRIAPLPDYRGEHLDYEQHLQDLVVEYEPRSRTQMNFVELLSADWVRLARIRQCAERLATPTDDRHAERPDVDLERWERELALARHLDNCFATGCPFALLAGEAEIASDLVGRAARDLIEHAAMGRKDPENSSSSKPFFVEAELLHRRVRPKSLGVMNDRRLKQVISDKTPIAPAARRRWGILLDRVVEDAHRRLASGRQRLMEHERMCRQNLQQFLNQVPELTKLLDYESRCRRQIERNIGMLLELQKRQSGRRGSPGLMVQSADEG